MHIDNMIIYVEKPKESTKKSAINNNFNKVSELKIKIQNIRTKQFEIDKQYYS